MFNLFGQGVPLLVGILAIPLLIDGLGTERFGVLTLAWLVIGYFSFFDLGLGRAITVLVAERLGSEREQEVPAVVWTALSLMTLLGLVGTVTIGLGSPWLVRDALNIPQALQTETLRAFYLLALSIPIVVGTAGLRGVLETYQRFGIANVIRISMGVFSFLGPLLVLPFSKSLFPVVAVLLAGRLVAWLVHLVVCLRVVPALRREKTFRRAVVGPLLRFGGWMTVTNVVGPLMMYLDRFLIGALISVTAVAYYAAPYEVVTKLWILPLALVGVLMPAFSSSFARDRDRTTLLFGQAVKYLFLALFPVILLVVTLAYDGLDLWLGGEFAQNSTRVLQLLAVGVFLNSLANVPFALLQGVGRPDLGAKLHLVEVPLYLLALWWLLGNYGIEGAAVAWVARMAVDTLLIFAVALRLLPGSAGVTRRLMPVVGGALIILALAASLDGIATKGLFLSLTLLGFTLAAWFLVLTPDERNLSWESLKAFGGSLKGKGS